LPGYGYCRILKEPSRVTNNSSTYIDTVIVPQSKEHLFEATTLKQSDHPWSDKLSDPKIIKVVRKEQKEELCTKVDWELTMCKLKKRICEIPTEILLTGRNHQDAANDYYQNLVEFLQNCTIRVAR
jgi:hypothetical protein